MKTEKDFKFKVLVFDKKGALIKGVYCKDKDEQTRFKNAMYWVTNFKLKLGFSYALVDLAKEEARKKKRIEDAQKAIEKSDEKKAAAREIIEKKQYTNPQIMERFISTIARIDERLSAIEKKQKRGKR